MTSAEKRHLRSQGFDPAKVQHERIKAASVVWFDFTDRWDGSELFLANLPPAAAMGYHTAAAMHMALHGTLPTGVLEIPLVEFERFNREMIRIALEGAS